MSDLTKVANEVILKRLKDNLILVDCAGTLYQGDFVGGTNRQLIDYLSAMKAVGYEVQIFSNDPAGSQLALSMIELELENKFLFGQIHRKDLYDGVGAYIVIDDDHSTHRVDAAYKYSPTDERIAKTLRYSTTIDNEFGKRTLN